MLKKIIWTLSAVILLSCLLTACNTLQGAGQDISNGGHAISNAAS